MGSIGPMQGGRPFRAESSVPVAEPGLADAFGARLGQQGPIGLEDQAVLFEIPLQFFMPLEADTGPVRQRAEGALVGPHH